MVLTWKKSFSLERSDFYMINSLSIAIHDNTMYIFTSLSVDKMLLLRYVNWSTNFRGFPLRVEMVPSYLKHMNSVIFEFM